MASFPFRSVTSAVAVAIAATLLLPAAAAQREARTEAAFATVIDRRDAPVPGLGIDDFIVREDGLAREILGVEPAPPPSPIALLVDTSQAAEPYVSDLRRATRAFVEAIGASDQPPLIGLTGFGERPTTLADFTRGPALDVAVDRLFARSGTGAYLLEAILDVSGALGEAGAPRPAIVAFVVEDGPEFSNTLADRVAESLKASRATLWPIVLQGRSADLSSPEARERARVLTDIARMSGGINRTVLTQQALPGAFTGVASLLASTYRITYGRPDMLIPPERLEVGVRREDLRVLASSWAHQ